MRCDVNRRDFLRTAAAGLAGATALARGAEPPAGDPPFRLYAMDTGLRGTDVPTLEAKADLLKKLGYVGVGYSLNHQELPRLLEELDKRGLELCAVYTVPSLEGPLDPALAGSVKLMKGRATRIEMAIRSGKLKPSDPAGDAQAAELLTRASDLAADTGPVVSVYPHTGLWTERVDDGVRLAERVGRKNVGTHFNLVHWKWVKQTKDLATLLREALPHLFAVTINGMEGRKIVSLDQGDFDLTAFMRQVKDAGYRGLVGVQGYSVAGPSGEHLARSMRKWQEIVAALGL